MNALALSGRVGEARDRFRALLDHASPLSLLAEGIDPETRRQLGNYTQASSHIGLVDSICYLGHLDGYKQPGPPPMGIRLGDPVGVDDR